MIDLDDLPLLTDEQFNELTTVSDEMVVNGASPGDLTAYRTAFYKKVRNNGARHNADSDKQPPAQKSWRDHVVTADELQKMEFDPVRWAVNTILPEGVAILAGAPKLGKSWLALDIALRVAEGGQVMEKFDCTKGDVLCLALEDPKRRLKRRLQKLYPHGTWPKSLTFSETWRLLGAGGDADILEWVEEADNPRLIIIDTLEKIRLAKGEQDGYSADYDVGSYLTAITKKHNITILVVHHVRKAISEDPLQMVSGTMGLTGGVDGVMVLRRDRLSDGNANLFVTGRDIEEESDYAVKFDDGYWSFEGDADDFRGSDEWRKLSGLLRPAGLKTIEIARLYLEDESLKSTDPRYGKVKALIKRAKDAGRIYQDEHDRYQLSKNPF